jgi:hypothetical protein
LVENGGQAFHSELVPFFLDDNYRKVGPKTSSSFRMIGSAGKGNAAIA